MKGGRLRTLLSSVSRWKVPKLMFGRSRMAPKSSPMHRREQFEVPVVGSASVVEVAVSSKGNEMVEVENFDVLACLRGPGG